MVYRFQSVACRWWKIEICLFYQKVNLCIFGCFTFKILGRALLIWFNVSFFTYKYCYLFSSLFISITIIFTNISIVAVTIINFKFDFHFGVFFFLNSMVLCFVVFKPRSVPFFFPHSFSVVTVNCNNRGIIQINEFEWHSLLLTFNSDWWAVFGKYIFVLFPPD